MMVPKLTLLDEISPAFGEWWDGGGQLTFLIVGGVILAALGALFLIELLEDLGGPFSWGARLLSFFYSRKVKPVVAYKKAQLANPASFGGDSHFVGVMGNGYKAIDSTSTMGFHAYESLNGAIEHPQRGQVILEVMLSGVIQDHELGYVASKQRVLQIIPQQCGMGDCNRTPTHFSFNEHGSSVVTFYCSVDAAILGGPKKEGVLRTIYHRSLTALSNFPTAQEVVRPLSEMGDVFPWIAEHNIVVASLKGANRFKPTILPRR